MKKSKIKKGKGKKILLKICKGLAFAGGSFAAGFTATKKSQKTKKEQEEILKKMKARGDLKCE